ncbi:MAG: alpha-mannosidase [Rikenellaceae bacterium]|nr:alpha-mannosidase [Rikenellaceae bacterium]
MKHLFAAILVAVNIAASGQDRQYDRPVYFVDGYHGGVYGHYPVEWKTQFLVDRLAAHPEWRICLEIEPETWDTVARRTPAAYENFRKIAADPRVEFTNPAYAQPYCYNVSGESIIRQFEYGVRMVRRHFPDVRFDTYSVEEPCFTSCLPQVLASFGFKYAVLKCPNTCWGGYSEPYGSELVNWTGPDGTAILTVPRYACEALEENSTWQTTAWGNHRNYLDACIEAGVRHPVGMCYQDAGWGFGPWIGSGDSIRNNSTYVTWREYFEQKSDRTTTDDYRMTQEGVRPNLMWGSQVLQTIARQVRKAENRVTEAEKMGVIAALTTGRKYDRAQIDEAWRTLMLAQHHDSWIVPYNILNRAKRLTWADEIATWTDNTCRIGDRVIEVAMQGFTAPSAGAPTGYVRVFNTLGTPRTDVATVALPEQYGGMEATVTDANGKTVDSRMEGRQLSFRADAPAFGFATYRIEGGKAAPKTASKTVLAARTTDSGEVVVENDMYRIVFDASRGGVIKSLVARKEGDREFVDRTNRYALGELRGHFYREGRFRSSTESHAKITVTKSDALQTETLIEGQIAGNPFRQSVTIAKGRRRIDFDLRIDWRGNVGVGEYDQRPDDSRNNRRAFSDDRFKLNVLFPTSLARAQLCKDAPFDVCESRLESTAFNSWDSIKHNVILNWISLDEKAGHGLALFSDHTTSYSCAPDFPLGLTLQYSGHGLWGRDYPISGPTEVRYALVPHGGVWDRAAIATENSGWNEPLKAVYCGAMDMESRSLVDLTGTGYQISAAQLVDSGIALRLFNVEGDDKPRRVKLGFKAASVDEVTLAGEVVGHVNTSADAFETAMPRFGFRTFIIR